MLHAHVRREAGHASSKDHGDTGNKPHHEEQAYCDTEVAMSEDQEFAKSDHGQR